MSSPTTTKPVLPNWPDKYWKSLVWSLQQGNCILLLGDEATGDSRRLKQQLASELAGELGLEKTPEFPQVARLYEMENARSDLERAVVQFYAAHAHDESGIHHALAKLPFYLAITSCHDSLLRNAFTARPDKESVVAYYNYKAGSTGLAPKGSQSAPLIYQLYGSVEAPQSLVLTENDLLDFLVKVISKVPPIPDNIRSELQRPDKTFLFLGFGIMRWYLRVLLHVLKSHVPGSRSFALEQFDPSNPAELDQAVFFYRTGYRIEVFDGDIDAFVKELTDRWTALHRPGMPQAPLQSPEDTPTAFISYASENKRHAVWIYKGLKQAGIEPWMDEDLEAGTVWDPAIEARIKENDYFVLLLSEALYGKPGSYVDKEIRLALETQGKSKDTYIIPVKIEECHSLPELAGFQTLQVSSAEDISKLASQIKRAHERRRLRSQ